MSEFVFPLPHRPSRIAVIGGGFRLKDNMRMFAATDAAGINEWNPEVIVAPLEDMLRLVGLAKAPGVALVIITSVDGTRLTPEHRCYLWNTCQIPVFEQLRGANGRIIARECQAHDGLHLRRGLIVQVPQFELTAEECECGSKIPRLRREGSEKKYRTNEDVQ